MSSPTARTLKLARELGFHIGVVERYNSFTKQRTDLFGFIDLVAVKPGVGVVGIQACAAASHAARRDKIRESPLLADILASGMRVEVWSWAKQGGRGKRKVWTVRREEILPEACNPACILSPTPVP